MKSQINKAKLAFDQLRPVWSDVSKKTKQKIFGSSAKAKLKPYYCTDPVSYTHLDVYKRQG